MVKFIARALILSLLMLNNAWAVDECTLTDSGAPDGLSIQTDTQLPVNSPISDFDCDDWCHVWANPVVPSDAIGPKHYTLVTINGGFYTLSYFSLTIPPPFHPPVA